MLVVHKFVVKDHGSFALVLKKGAKILHVAEQHGQPCFWVLIDRNAPVDTRHFRAMMTGEDLNFAPDDLTFLGTVLFQKGHFVIHYFEVQQ